VSHNTIRQETQGINESKCNIKYGSVATNKVPTGIFIKREKTMM
jgi:hypothetical protein